MSLPITRHVARGVREMCYLLADHPTYVRQRHEHLVMPLVNEGDVSPLNTRPLPNRLELVSKQITFNPLAVVLTAPLFSSFPSKMGELQ